MAKITFRTADGRRHIARLTTDHPQSSYGIPVIETGGVAYGTADIERHNLLLLAQDQTPENAEALRQAGYALIGKEIETMTAEQTITQAIEESIHHTETVHVTVDAGDIQAVLADIGGIDDYSEENDGSYDVWGDDDGSEWRLRITLTR